MAKRTVLFLGAGASRPLGFPVTDGILPGIWEGLQGKAWRKWPGLRTRRDQQRLRDELVQLLQVLLPGLATGPATVAGASIVDVISLLDQLILEGRSPHPSVRDEQLLRGRILLQLGINAVLRGGRLKAVRNRLVEWAFHQVVHDRDSRLTIISTNYDTAVEQRLFGRLIKLHRSIGRNVDFGISWRDPFRNLLHVRPRAARLAVFKLHGSLNWLRCESCGHVTINVQQRVASLEFWNRRRQRKRGIRDYNRCRCAGRLRSVMVTPSVVRDVRDANLLSIWNAAMEDLRRASEWILIGYSLPSEDIAIRSLLLRAYHTRSRQKGLRIRVVQLEPQSENGERAAEYRRYRMFFPVQHLREGDYERGGLEPFVNGLHISASEVPSRSLRSAFPHVPRSELAR